MAGREPRPNEILADIDPAQMEPSAGLVYIGHVRSPWTDRADCPKNMVQARERQKTAEVLVDPAWRSALKGLSRYSHAILLVWLDQSERNLVIQNPAHADQPTGTFSLRSPVRPNPIGLEFVQLLEIDEKNGVIKVDAVDCLDNTPLIDIKPYFASTDAIPEATKSEKK